MKLFSLLFIFLGLISIGHAANPDTQYVLYSPLANEGQMSANGTWVITDPCAASMAQQNE